MSLTTIRVGTMIGTTLLVLGTAINGFPVFSVIASVFMIAVTATWWFRPDLLRKPR